MSDALRRAEPVFPEPFAGEGVTIALAPPMARFSLRARDRATLEVLLGRKLPEKIGSTDGEIACLGPDEWLLRTTPGTALPRAKDCRWR